VSTREGRERDDAIIKTTINHIRERERELLRCHSSSCKQARGIADGQSHRRIIANSTTAAIILAREGGGGEREIGKVNYFDKDFDSNSYKT
jgi:hypothetical protein